MNSAINGSTWAQHAIRFLLFWAVLAEVTAQPQTLDTFNPGANNVVNALPIQTDGKILVAGAFTNLGGLTRSYLGRLNANGTPDTGFTNAANNTVNCVLVQTDGGIVVGGTFTTLGGSTRNAIGRLGSSGTLDFFFNPGASASPNSAFISALAAQPDGKLLVAGFFNSLGGFSRTNIGRLNASGVLDVSFNTGLGSGLQNISSLAVQPDGKILIGGSFTNLGGQQGTNIARLNSNGTLDTNFNAAADSVVSCLAMQPDGKILVGGLFTNLSGQACNYIGRLNSDGSFDADCFDANFNSGASDGKIVIGGAFTRIGEQLFYSLARLGTDGTVETNFHPFAGCCGGMHALALQTDGKILVAGNVTGYLARLNSDGTWEGSFNPAVNGLCAEVNCFALQSDGKIVVGGSFTSLGGQACTNLGRLNTNGTLDASFHTATAAACSDVLCVALQPDGKILYGGEFGPGDSRLGRLNPDGTPDSSFATLPVNRRVFRAKGIP